jgi:hypothetical protein
MFSHLSKVEVGFLTDLRNMQRLSSRKCPGFKNLDLIP